jgi:hypothetical protein
MPLLAVIVDQLRATLACAPNGQTCLEAAGQGSLGAVGPVVLVLYALAAALVVARLLVRREGLVPRWLIGAAGVAAVCGGQALLTGAIADGGALGGGWPELLAMSAAAGGALALALRAAPALVRSLRPTAPRPRTIPLLAIGAPVPVARRSTGAPLATSAAGRAPPLTLR